MKKILWVSRHPIRRDQIKELRQIHGDIEIISMATKVTDPYDIKLKMEEIQADDVVVVLPLNHIATLISIGIQPLRAVMDHRYYEEDGITKVQYRHEYFERIKNVEIEREKVLKEEV